MLSGLDNDPQRPPNTDLLSALDNDTQRPPKTDRLAVWARQRPSEASKDRLAVLSGLDNDPQRPPKTFLQSALDNDPQRPPKTDRLAVWARQQPSKASKDRPAVCTRVTLLADQIKAHVTSGFCLTDLFPEITQGWPRSQTNKVPVEIADVRFLPDVCPSCTQTNSVKALKA